MVAANLQCEGPKLEVEVVRRSTPTAHCIILMQAQLACSSVDTPAPKMVKAPDFKRPPIADGLVAERLYF